MLTKEQLELRKAGIGASEIAAVCGVNPYRSALDVWMVKTSRQEPFAGNVATEWGTRLEASVLAKYADAHSVTVERGVVTYHCKDESWMLATPDGFVVTEPHYGLEVKTAGARSAWRWGQEGDDMPEEYLLQIAWSCAVLGYQRWDLAVLIGGQDYREYRYDRDMALEERLIELGREFWQCVVNDTPPEPDASQSASEALARLYPKNILDIKESTGEINDALEGLIAAKATVKIAATKQLGFENQIKAFIKDADGVEGPTTRATWRATKSSHWTDWETIAGELGASKDVIKAHTIEKPGVRRFYVREK